MSSFAVHAIFYHNAREVLFRPCLDGVDLFAQIFHTDSLPPVFPAVKQLNPQVYTFCQIYDQFTVKTLI